jgi:hypothetical protein
VGINPHPAYLCTNIAGFKPIPACKIIYWKNSESDSEFFQSISILPLKIKIKKLKF